MPSVAFAANTADKVSGADASAAQNVAKAFEESENTDIYDYVGDASESGEKENAEEAEQYPEVFDLSDGRITRATDARNIVTPVKNQSPYGTCWSFGTMAAAEGSIISETLANDKDLDLEELKKNMDLSEKHLAWFAYGQIEDKDNSQYGEGFVIGEQYGEDSLYSAGGSIALATGLFASGVGPVSESRVVDDNYPNLLKYQGLNGNIDYTSVWDEDAGKYIQSPSQYSTDDDWSIPYQYRFCQSYKLEESYVLPSPAGQENGHYVYNEAGTNAIKDQLIQGRPVSIGYCADTSLPGQAKNGTYINLKTWSHYTYDENETASHAVTIVGYDDNYSKDNFNEGNPPEGDGAFLVKNSWGSSESVFPNKGADDWGIEVNGKNTGYFWLSYYDRTISMVEALDFDIDPTDDESYNIDQYDYCDELNPMNETSETLTKSSNVFTADERESVFSVGCQTAAPNTEVTYDLYILSDKSEYPEDGYKAASKTVSYEYGGYHQCNLDENVIIQKGQRYSIVVTQHQSDGEYAVFMNAVFSEKYYKQMKGLDDVGGHAVLNEGESYIYQNGQWKDFKDVAAKSQKIANNLIEIDNFSIKAYSKPCSGSARLKCDLPEGAMDRQGDSGSLGANYVGNIFSLADDSIEWKSTNEKVMKISDYVDEKGRVDNFEINITATGIGTAYLVASNKEVGSYVVKITVSSPQDAKIKKTTANKNGITVQWKADAASNGYLVTYGVSGGTMKTVDLDASKFSEDTDPYFTVSSPAKYKTYKFTVCGYGYDGDGNKIKGKSATAYVTQKPDATTIKKVSGITKGISVKWYKRTCTGYQVQYSLKKSMKNAKTKTISKASTTSRKIKSLKKGKRYYVRVRSYNKATGSVSYSSWSKIKSVKAR